MVALQSGKVADGQIVYRNPKGSPYGSHERTLSDRIESQELLSSREAHEHHGQNHAHPGLPPHHHHQAPHTNNTQAAIAVSRGLTAPKRPDDGRTDSAILHVNSGAPVKPHYTF